MSVFQELKRRNVLRVAAAYLAGAWLLVQVADTVFPVYGLETGALYTLISVIVIGFPLVLVLSWIFELTPEGLKLDHEVDRSKPVKARLERRLDRLIIVLLTLAVLYFAVDKFVLDPARDARMVEDAVEQGRSEALIESYGEKSIAVLPFVDFSPERDQEYFADGISDELLNLLAKIPELRVISRSSAFSFKGQNVDIQTVADRLNVANILEGSVRKAGKQVRVTAQLIDARTDTHLWSETYDRELANIFAIQDDIAAAVVSQLKIRLLDKQPKARAVDPDAYSLLLQARHFINQGTAESLDHASATLEEVLQIAPDFGSGWAELGRVYSSEIFAHRISRDEGYPKMAAAQQRALELNPEDALTHSRYAAALMMWEGNLPGSAAHHKKAFDLEPGNAAVLANAAPLMGTLGRHEEALRLIDLAIQRDPLNAAMYISVAIANIQMGRLDDAEEAMHTSIRISPKQLNAHATLARVLRLKGEHQAALDALQSEPLPFARLSGEAMSYHSLGDQAASDAALETLVEQFDDVAPAFVAHAYAWRDDVEGALEWIERALNYTGPIELIYILHAPEYETVRRDPRWMRLLELAGISPEQQAKVDFNPRLPSD